MKKKKKIIYIDSERRYRKRAKNAFAKAGYSCVLCHDGVEGLQRIEREDPDVVIVDYSLSDITGEEVYTRFLTDSRFLSMRDIPFISLITNGRVDKSKLYSLGFSACLIKPFRINELIEFVEDVIVSNQLKVEEIHFWETIREARDFLERVVESSTDSMVTTDKKGIITYCNRASEEMLGYGFEELVGRRASEFLEGGATELLKISALLRKRKKVQNLKTVIIRNDGKKIPINLSISTMKDEEGRVIGALGISKEIIGEGFTEYDTNESDRVAVVLETAVAVNHAINNPLVPILGNAQFLLQDEQIVDEDVRRRLRTIVNNALRIRDITQKLARIRHPVTKEYLRGTRMLDIEAST